MRVLHVVHSARAGGATAVAVTLVEHAPTAVTEQRVVFLQDGPAVAEVGRLGVRAEVVQTGRMREPWRVPGAVGALRRALREVRADVVLAHVSKAHVFAAAAGRREHVPEVWWQHEHLGLNRPLQELAGRVPASLVICSSGWTAAAQAARFPRTPVSHVPPAALASARTGPAREHVTASAPVYGVIGRLARWKRVELAIDAFAVVAREEPQARLTIVGGEDDAGYLEQLRAQVAASGLDGSVTFAGHVRGGVTAVLAGIDVLVHCARLEPFGLAPVEALAHGIPVVGVAEGGLTETVRHEIDGLLVPALRGDLARAMLDLGRDPQRRARMGAAGRERATAEFAAETCAATAWAALAGVTGQALS